MHLAQGKIAKHKREAFSKMLLNLMDDGIGLSAIRTQRQFGQLHHLQRFLRQRLAGTKGFRFNVYGGKL
jgi:hypothetical protein